MKQKFRYRRKGKGDGLVAEWPATALDPDTLAERVSYEGSHEHKAMPIHPSYGLKPGLRSDASRCDPSIAKDRAEAALRDAVRRSCVSSTFTGFFPCYVWGWLDGQPHVARLMNSEAGTYKAWPIGEEELPIDRDGRLHRANWVDDA